MHMTRHGGRAACHIINALWQRAGRQLLLLLSLLALHSGPLWAAGAPAAMPANSLYWLNLPLRDTGGQKLALSEMQGAPLLVTMFYGNCATACPIILENLKQTVALLKPAPGKLHVLLVSLDPLHDSPATLLQLQQNRQLDAGVFRLAVSDNPSHTRMLAAALGINYRTLSSGEINHTTRVTLLDAAGVIRADSSATGVTPDPAFLQQIRQLMN